MAGAATVAAMELIRTWSIGSLQQVRTAAIRRLPTVLYRFPPSLSFFDFGLHLDAS